MEVGPGVEKVKVFDILPEAKDAFMDEMKDKYPRVEWVAAGRAWAAAEGRDIVITCTPSLEAPSSTGRGSRRAATSPRSEPTLEPSGSS